jgi:2-dehydro-3-deoxygluconokinase
MGLFVDASGTALRGDRSTATVDAGALTVGMGGAESNVAIGLARLGVPTAWVGRVGADSLGERIAEIIRAEGVLTLAIVNGSAPTGLMLKERTPAGSKVSYYRAHSAGSTLSAADIPGGLIEHAAVLHITGITPGLSDSAAAAVSSAIEVASAAGVAVSFDVNHRAGVWGARDAAAVYRQLASRSTIVFAGHDEAVLVLGRDGTPAELAAGIAALGPREVVIKLGSHGAFVWHGGTHTERAAVSVKVIDTVGAGDAFVASYLAGIVAGLPIADRLRDATIAGALACTVPGDWEGLPSKPELASARKRFSAVALDPNAAGQSSSGARLADLHRDGVDPVER